VRVVVLLQEEEGAEFPLETAPQELAETLELIASLF
jgi:hypothetical protein